MIWEIGLPGGLPPPRPPGPGASGANRGPQNGGAAAEGRRPPILGGAAEGRPAPVGAGGARSGGSGGREPPRKANFPKFCNGSPLVAICNWVLLWDYQRFLIWRWLEIGITAMLLGLMLLTARR